MKIAVLGTGMVGRAHAGKLASLGHEVFMGTRDVKKTIDENKTDATGKNPFNDWYKLHRTIKLITFSEAAEKGELIVEALNGAGALEILSSIKGKITGKVLIDISNPLDFSKGFPPTLFVSNTDSLGEQIQRVLPDTNVVKTLHTTNAYIQVDPGQLAGADHDVFICGNDTGAKAKVTRLLKSYGWKNIIDLGDITAARGTEMMLPLWVRLMGTLQQPNFNFKIVLGLKP